MSNDDPLSSCPELFIGIWVTVKMKNSGDRYRGTVTFVDVEDNAFGLKDVERAAMGEQRFSAMEGFYQFFRKEVELIAASDLPLYHPSRNSSDYMPGQNHYGIVTDPSPAAAKALEDKKEPSSLDPPTMGPPSMDPPT